MNAKDFLKGISAQMDAQRVNPARALIREIIETRTTLIEHAQNCTACKAPKPKARAAFLIAQDHIIDVMFVSSELQITEARMALSGEAKLMGNGSPMLAARAACATAQNTLILLRLMAARIHDADPDLEALEHLRGMLEPLVDAIDVHNVKAKGGLN